MKEVKGLKPFGKFIMTIGQLPASYLVSMTYEEQLIWLCNYLQNVVIPTVNNNGEAVEELQNLYIELKEYVDNYFENLDVQEEINNKLDDMAESGELAEIISQFLTLGVLFTFNTASDLAAAENLFDGASAYILGKNTYNDGKGAFYKIRELLNTDTPDGDNIITITNSENLVAEKLPNYYINEINNTISEMQDEFNIIYSNISELVSDTTLTDGKKVKTLGYHSINDGGSGTYLIRTKTESDTDDGGSIIEIGDSLVAELIIDDKINVKQFGAYGDGETNDITAIQNAIDCAIDKNKKVIFDEDTYYIATGIVIDSDNVDIECNGTITTDNNIACITYNGLNSNIYINKMTNTNVNRVGIAFLSNYKMSGVNLKINYIYGFGKGISLDTSINNDPFGIFYNKINNDYMECDYCIYLNANYSFINSNFFYLGHLSGGTGVYSAAINNEEDDRGEYNGNNFYDIGFEILSKACELNNFISNTFENFRCMESITSHPFFILSSSHNNMFSSVTTSFINHEDISDDTTNRYEANIWNMLLVLRGSANSKVTKFLTYNNTYFVIDNLSLEPTKGMTNQEFHTNSVPLSCMSIFYIEGSTSTGSKLYLDNRYKNANSLYDDIFVVCYMPNGNSGKVRIYYENDANPIFDSDNFVTSSGTYKFIGKLNVSNKLEFRKIN